jgi:hypothetical protein
MKLDTHRKRKESNMNSYRVFFYKDLLNSDGHRFKCLQRQIDVQSDGPSQAQVLAARLIDNHRLNADSVEVTHLTDGHHELAPSIPAATPSQQTWSRAS